MYRWWKCYWSRSESVAAVSTELQLVPISCASQKTAVQWSATHLFIWPYKSQLFLFPYVKTSSKGDNFRVSRIEKDVTIKLNSVPLRTFNESFVQLFQTCKNSVAVKIKQFSPFSYISVLIHGVQESYCLIYNNKFCITCTHARARTHTHTPTGFMASNSADLSISTITTLPFVQQQKLKLVAIKHLRQWLNLLRFVKY
jgi:hypothetical protein